MTEHISITLHQETGRKEIIYLTGIISQQAKVRPHACNFSFMVILCAEIKMGDAGLGFIKQTEVPPKQTHDYRKLVSDKVHDLEEERYFAKAVQLRVQGNWTRWCNYIQNELSWKHLLVTSPRLTYFVLGATFDTLPSPTNLKRGHITTEADCSLCYVKI